MFATRFASGTVKDPGLTGDSSMRASVRPRGRHDPAASGAGDRCRGGFRDGAATARAETLVYKRRARAAADGRADGRTDGPEAPPGPRGLRDVSPTLLRRADSTAPSGRTSVMTRECRRLAGEQLAGESRTVRSSGHGAGVDWIAPSGDHSPRGRPRGA